MKIKNVIFDLDGTLLDTSQGIMESIEYTIERMNFQKISYEQKKSFIGPPLKTAFIDVFGCSEEVALIAVKLFRAHYQDGPVLHARPYDGIIELCKELTKWGMEIGVATNKPQRFADALLQEYGLIAYLKAVFGTDEYSKFGKADLIRLCLERLSMKKDETVLIGDTDNDAKGAEDAGIPFIAVTYGFGFKSNDNIVRQNLVGVAHTPMEIAELVQRLGM